MTRAMETVQAMARHNPEWSEPEHADGACYNAAARLCMAMWERGVRSARIIEADGAQGNHYAVIVRTQQTVYDLTYRQFDNECDYPTVLHVEDWTHRLGFELGGNLLIVVDEQGPPSRAQT